MTVPFHFSPLARAYQKPLMALLVWVLLNGGGQSPWDFFTVPSDAGRIQDFQVENKMKPFDNAPRQQLDDSIKQMDQQFRVGRLFEIAA